MNLPKSPHLYGLSASLVIAGCFLIFFGWSMILAPGSAFWSPAAGFALAVLGVTICLGCHRLTGDDPEIRSEARKFMAVVLLLAPGPLAAYASRQQPHFKGVSIVFAILLLVGSVVVLASLAVRRSRLESDGAP
jgi:hypothetical protein